jgi:hypothetical protein
VVILSDHRWCDRAAGLREMRRVAGRRVLILNADPGLAERFWLSREYLPGFLDLIPAPYRRPGHWSEELRELLGEVRVRTVAVPHDCRDGFYQAYWRWRGYNATSTTGPGRRLTASSWRNRSSTSDCGWSSPRSVEAPRGGDASTRCSSLASI